MNSVSASGSPVTLDRIKGCLLGAAVGDALGMPFEGASGQSIGEKWDGRSFLPSGFLSTLGLRPGQFTDDTQLLLATAEAIVSAGGFDAKTCADYYLQSFMRGIRGVGGSTRESLQRLKEGTSWRFSGAKSREAAGNGVAMLIAPLGLYHGITRRPGLARNVRLCGVITHRNSTAIEGAIIIARFIEAITLGVSKDKILIHVKQGIFSPFRRPFTILNKLVEARATIPKAAEVLGTSGYVVHSVPLAVYCFLAYDNYEECVVNAVMAGGDTDTNATMAGALAGCYYGEEAIPKRWSGRVEGAARIRSIAQALGVMMA